jgi:hypothetical protein
MLSGRRRLSILYFTRRDIDDELGELGGGHVGVLGGLERPRYVAKFHSLTQKLVLSNGRKRFDCFVIYRNIQPNAIARSLSVSNTR